jgi:hypothetical protein
VHVGLHHHREQRPVNAPAPLQQRREERPLTELGDLELDITGWSRQQARPMTVALVRARLGSLMRLGTDERGRFRLDQLLQDPLQAGADPVGELARLQRVK